MIEKFEKFTENLFKIFMSNKLNYQSSSKIAGIHFDNINPLYANPTKWSNTLK